MFHVESNYDRHATKGISLLSILVECSLKTDLPENRLCFQIRYTLIHISMKLRFSLVIEIVILEIFERIIGID